MQAKIEGRHAEKLHPRVVEVARRLGYEKLLPVQEASIPQIMAGYHTLVVAPTGSGKTEAALFPVLSLLLRDIEERGDQGGVRVIYITPLRALNRDVTHRIQKIVEGVGLRIQLRHGDTTQTARKKFLREPPHVMVTTPESLNLLLTVKERDKLWAHTAWVIVDEIHELLDNKRGAELSVVLERLSRLSKRRIQRIGLSATLSDRSLAEAKRLLAGSRRVVVARDSTSKTYSIGLEVVEGGDGFWERAVERLARIISQVEGSVLVFTNTRGTAEKLAAILAERLDAEVEVHHGSLSRRVREQAEEGFREGRVKVLVATSSMELGIDIGSVDLVIQFMSPRQVITMVQRAGRAGHRLGETSRAVIVTSDNLFETLESGVIAFRAERGYLEDLRLPKKSYDVLAHQLAGLLLEREGSVRFDEAYDLVTRAGSMEELEPRETEDVLEHLDMVRVVRWFPEERIYRMGRRTRSYFYRVSMIPDETSFSVHDLATGARIGEVSERFVEASLLQAGDKQRFRFVLGGKVWEAVSVDYEKGRIDAVLLAASEGLIPSWEGEIIPVSAKVAREVCSLISLCEEDPEACKRVLQARKIPEPLIEKYTRVLQATAKAHGRALDYAFPIVEEVPGAVVLYSCLGSKGNLALALLLSKILEPEIRVEFDYIPYAIIFRSPSGVRGESVRSALIRAAAMDPLERLAFLQDAIRASRTYLIRFMRVAKRMGVVEPDKRLPLEFARKLAENYQGTVVDVETVREILHEKVDHEVMNAFLDSLRGAHLASLDEPSPLAREVFENPYVKRDVAVKMTQIAMDKIIESIKKSLSKKEVRFVCLSCGKSWTMMAGEASRGVRCPKCGALMVAPLPASEYGERLLEAYRKSKRREKLSRDEKKMAKEVVERGMIYLNYASQGLGNYVVEALMSYGVGPSRARRLLSTVVERGERAFYEQLLKAMQDFAATRQYWATPRPSSKSSKSRTKRGRVS